MRTTRRAGCGIVRRLLPPQASRARMSRGPATMGAIIYFLLPHVERGFFPGAVRVASSRMLPGPQTLQNLRSTHQDQQICS